jgi:hypothetical protein
MPRCFFRLLADRRQQLIAGSTLNMLEQSAEKSKSILAVRALVHVVIVEVICVVITPVAVVGNAIESVAVDTTYAASRFQMDHHGRNSSNCTTTSIAFYIARSIDFFVLARIGFISITLSIDIRERQGALMRLKNARRA